MNKNRVSVQWPSGKRTAEKKLDVTTRWKLPTSDVVIRINQDPSVFEKSITTLALFCSPRTDRKNLWRLKLWGLEPWDGNQNKPRVCLHSHSIPWHKLGSDYHSTAIARLRLASIKSIYSINDINLNKIILFWSGNI